MFTAPAEPCPWPASFLPTFCLFSRRRTKLCSRAKRIQIAEAVIFVTPLPGSFLSCPLTFVKVKGILPRRLSACYLGWNQLPELHEEYFMQILRCALDGSSVTDPLPVPRSFISPTTPDSPHASGVRAHLAADVVISEGEGKPAGFARQRHWQLKKHHLLMCEQSAGSAINRRPHGSVFTSPLADC